MANKSNSAEVGHRVNEIYQQLILRQTKSQIMRYAAENWGEIKERQVENYIHKANNLLLLDLSGDRKQFLAEQIATRNILFQKAFELNKLQICLQILYSIAKLQGLFEPVRVIDKIWDDSWDSVVVVDEDGL